MNLMITTEPNGPVEPKYYPICGFDAEGRPVALRLSSGGEMPLAGGATEVTLGAVKARSFGESGSEFLSQADGAVAGRNYYGLMVVSDAVLLSITLGSGSTGGARLVGATLPAGLVLLVPVTGLTISSGVVQALKA